jgi:hypothetical protein
MANSVLLKRSSTENKRPVAASMLNGELDLNYSDISGGIFYKNASGSVVKVGPAQVGTTAPNSTPAGSAGNSVGEFWYDTSASSLKLWDGSAWQTCGALSYPGTTSYIPDSYIQWPTPANPTDRVAVEGDVTALFSAGQLIAFPDVSGATQYTLQSTQYLSGSDATAFTFAVNPAPATTYSGPMLITAATQYTVKGVNAGTGISLSFDTDSDSLYISNSVPPVTFQGSTLLLPDVSTASAPNVFTSQGNAVGYIPVGSVIQFAPGIEEDQYTVLTSGFVGVITTVTVSPDWVNGVAPSAGSPIYRSYNDPQPVGPLVPGTNVTFEYNNLTDALIINAATTAATTPGGPTNAIQFNNGGVFGGEANFTYDPVNDWMILPALFGNTSEFNIGGFSSTGNGGNINIRGGVATLNAGATGGDVSLFPGAGGDGGVGGSVVIRGASTGGTTGSGGDITITGGVGRGATFTSGDVIITPGTTGSGATSGTVQISGISTASATATYTPTAATDLATKAYVDAAADGGVAGANTQVQFNNNGAFGASSSLTFTAAAGGNPSYLSLQKVQGFDAENLTLQGGTSGQVNITGGSGLAGSTINGGNILLTPGTAAPGGIDGQTQIFSIGLATTIAGYTPLTANSLTDKAYVDGLTNPVAWIPNNTAPTTANNGDFWLNTTNGPFALQQRISGAWATNDTTGAIVNNVISTAVNSVPYPTLYDIIGVGGAGGYNVSTALNDIIFATNYTVTSSFNKITNVVTFTFTNTTGNTDLGTLLNGFVVGEKYVFQMANDNEVDWVITSRANGNTAPFPVTFTARIADQVDVSTVVALLAAVPGVTVTDYEITGLGKDIFNGVSGIDPAIRGVLAPNSSTTGSFLYWTAPSNPPGGPYDVPQWKLVGIADMIQAGAGIGVTYDDQGGAYTITNSNPGPSFGVNTALAPTVVDTLGDGTFTNFGDSTSVYTTGLVIIFSGDPARTRFTVTGATYDNNTLKTTVGVTPNWTTSGFTPAANATTVSTVSSPIAYLNPGNNVTFDYYPLQDSLVINAAAQTTPAAGANTQVQYNDNGAFGAEADFAYTAGTNTLTVGNITGTAANFSLVTPAQATTDTDGYNITIASGDGNGTGIGGVLNLRGGGGTYGGDVNITGAVSSVAAGFSGSVYINGGAPGIATAEGGTVEIRGSATANLVNGFAGNVTLAGGNIVGAGGTGGDAYVSGGSAANPGDLILFAGTTTANNGTGGNVAITGGLVAAGIGTSGTAGNITITGGTGAGSTNVTGGNVTIAGGASLGTGTRGGVSITDITAASAKATYTPTAATDLTTKSYVDGALVPGGANGQVQFNNNGVFGGDADLTYNPSTNVLTIPNILSGNSTLDLVAGVQTASNNPGHNVSLSAGAGNGDGAGGEVIISGGGSAGLAVAGGAVNIKGGNATGTSNTAGGNVVISGGDGIGTGADGNVIITDISQVTAKATYTPTNGVDLTTKSYVDGLVAAPGTVTGAVNISNATASSSKTTGALIVAGGVGVSGDVYANTVHTDSLYAIGTNITAYSDIVPNTASTRSLGSAALPWQEVYIQAGSLHLAAANPSVNPVTVSNAANYFQLSGGGFKILDTGGTTTLYQVDPVTALVTSEAQTQITNSNNTTGVGTGSFQTAGGAYVAKDLIVTGSITANNLVVSTPNYATIISTATQNNTTINTAHAVTYSSVAYGTGITIANNSRVTVSRAGVYNFVVSLQVQKSDNGSDDFDLWLGKNGTYLPNSTSHYTLVSQGTSELVAVVNFALPLLANDYIQLFWSSADANIFLLAQTGLTNPTRPDVPSVILTVTEVK